MKKLSLLLLAILVFVGCSDDKATFVVNFEGKIATGENQFKSNKNFVPGDYASDVIYDNDNLIAVDHYFADWGGGYTFSGFTVTNGNDKTTGGYSNPSAITGKAKTGTSYLTVSLNKPPQIRIDKPNVYNFKGAWITNATYTYLAIKDGNDGGFGSVTKFKDGDWCLLEIKGYDLTGNLVEKIDIYLADFRGGKSKILNEWIYVDFDDIATAEYIEFAMTSTDNGQWGMNTPAYFCMDGITLEEE